MFTAPALRGLPCSPRPRCLTPTLGPPLTLTQVIFSPTTSSHTLDLMWPDFSFMPPLGNHELVTPRWDVARKAVLEAGGAIPWSRKLDFAAWTGNTQVGEPGWMDDASGDSMMTVCLRWGCCKSPLRAGVREPHPSTRRVPQP